MPTPIAERLLWTVELLAVQPDDHLLEIGCGPGVAVSLVCERLERGTITAIDRSATAVARARRRNRECIAAGRARIEQCALEDAALHRAPLMRPYTKAFAVNVNAFWTSPASALAALRRAIPHEATLFIVYETPSTDRQSLLGRKLHSLLPAHGFRITDARTRQLGARGGICIIGRRA